MKIIKPTLLLNKARTLRNIERMAQKAKNNGVRFRPHFKTHQSAHIGEWFRDFGVNAITVSSLDMAGYFAQHGWQDITVAFPVNILEIEQIKALSAKITLHLLVEAPEVARFLEAQLDWRVHVWLKVDVGAQRTGIAWNDMDALLALAKTIGQTQHLALRGLLTHAGHAYRARTQAEIAGIYAEMMARLTAVRDRFALAGFPGLEISIGDTPSCSVIADFRDVDEIRPGNFVFYDVMQLTIGSCAEEDLAVAVACPVVAKHAARRELVLYGGAVHLSKDYVTTMLPGRGETKIYGYLALPEPAGWGPRLPHTYVSALSQEHGIVKTTPAFCEQAQIGDLVMVLPVHACLTAHLLRKYVTLEGELIELAVLT